MTARYRYIGSNAIRDRALTEPSGTRIVTRDDLHTWLARNADAFAEGATFVVDVEGTLRLAPRRSEHVACADGGDVLTAGEIVFARDRKGNIALSDVTNQSTGYCPEPSSFTAIAAALDAIGVSRPAGWTAAFVFRRCDRCGQLAIVKDGVYECAICGGELPRDRNL